MRATETVRKRPLTPRNLAAEYQALHEGLPVDKDVYEPTRPPPRAPHVFGRLAQIWYAKKTLKGWEEFQHPFAEGSQPRMARDRRGKLWLYAGRYNVTERGIEDLPAWQQTRERLPGRPRLLVTLGKLQRVKYVRDSDAGTTVGYYNFEGRAQPILARDEHGNLHVLHGDYDLRLEGQEESITMRQKRKMARRANPSGGQSSASASKRPSLLKTGQEALFSTALIGGGAALSTVGVNMAMTKWAPVTWTPRVRSAAKMGAGVVLATGLALGHFAAPKYIPMVLAAGAGVGPFMTGLVEMYNQWDASRSVAPGAYAAMGSLPAGGVPAGFQAANGQFCFQGAGAGR